MTWFIVFSACIAAVLIANAVTAVIVALVIGIKTSRKPADPIKMVMEDMPEYPVDEAGNLKDMEPEPESEYESSNVRL